MRDANKGGAEGDSDDEAGSALFDLSPQELAELKERTANRSVHAIVKDGSLSQLRVRAPPPTHTGDLPFKRRRRRRRRTSTHA